MTAISFEYFPPRSDAQRESLARAHQRLSRLRPEYCSVTFGAGGTTLEATEQTVTELRRSVDAAPHLSCRAGSVRDLAALLDRYAEAGVRRIVALRGDRASGDPAATELRHASDLVAHIRRHSGDRFKIAVACYPEVHPEARTPTADLEHFVTKVEAGASEAITQYFFNADAYFRFVDRAARRGIEVPIVPGIMPITNFVQLARFSDICGAEIPRWLRTRLSELQDDPDALRAFGLDVMTDLCRRLLDGGAPALHFYTLNRSAVTLKICEQLGLGRDGNRTGTAG